jgi:H+-transporting ATPase
MDVLCVDKTGTLTLNELSVSAVRPAPGSDEAHVLVLACFASSTGGGDPVDSAIQHAASGKSIANNPRLLHFIPFDPARKIAEATIGSDGAGANQIQKGAFLTLAATAKSTSTISQEAETLEKEGSRVIAVAFGTTNDMAIIGLIAIRDTPRTDAAALISELKGNGIQTIMVTGDAVATAVKIATDVGMNPAVAPKQIPARADPGSGSVYAGVLPEDKYALVKAFQASGHTVGMCGDGANDAPALRQAQIGIAVSTATDVAKSAAGMVLTTPGLRDILVAVKEGRASFQRILTYTLNMILKKIVTVLFLATGLLLTGQAILTPLLMVIIMVTGDFLAMAITVDSIDASRVPNTWKIRNITFAGILLGSLLLAFFLGLFNFARLHLQLPIEELRTVTFLLLVFGGQATLYAVRNRHQLWKPLPNRWLLMSSVVDLAVASTFAVAGIAMTPLPITLVAGILGASIVFGLLVNFVKIPLFVRLRVA